MDLTWQVIVLLIASGIVVGVINTLAGGGTILTISIFTAMGLPITMANGTNRIAVVLQNLTASLTFIRKRMLDVKAGLLLSIPTIVGNILGSMLATQLDEKIFKICMGVVLAVILLYMIFDRHKTHIHGGHALKLNFWHYIWFFLIGFYGGYIYIGLGYVVLAVTIWTLHLDIITANILKGFVIFVSSPFSMLVFMYNGQVDYAYGLLHGLGNIIGAFLASHYAIGWGVRFVRLFTIGVVLLCFLDLLGWVSMARGVNLLLAAMS
uniref:sulfite exporter TauE/SafE family protein n=1 Tax=Alistipes sp. TaxID=1872444 RepID=UPI0040572D64